MDNPDQQQQCKRTSRTWRCPNTALPGKNLCEKHRLQCQNNNLMKKIENKRKRSGEKIEEDRSSSDRSSSSSMRGCLNRNKLEVKKTKKIESQVFRGNEMISIEMSWGELGAAAVRTENIVSLAKPLNWSEPCGEMQNGGFVKVESITNITQLTPHTNALCPQELSVLKPLNWSEPCAIPGGEMQNGGLLKVESIANRTQKHQDDLQMLVVKIKHHEDNLRFLKTRMDNLDESILDMQVNLGKYHSSNVAVVKNENIKHSQTEENTIEQILQQPKSAAGVLCQLKNRHGTCASQLSFMNHVLGVVATLGKVEDDNLSRLFSEYLGLETMMAIVCKTYEGIKVLEAYDDDGSIQTNLGLCALGPTIGRHMEGRFRAISLDDLRAYAGKLIADDPQRKLALVKPRLPSGECPPGFLGFAVNMINLDGVNLSYLTASRHGLRETLFYSLFSGLQVYRTRGEMLLALPCMSDGALSLDGGMIRMSGDFDLGNRKEVDVRFPISSGISNLPVNYLENVEKMKIMNWEKDTILEDIQREEALLNHANLHLASKKKESLKFIVDSAA